MASPHMGSKLGTILVRSVAQEDSLGLTLALKGKLHKLLRPKEESLERTLRRISLTANKIEKSNVKKRKKNAGQSIPGASSPVEARLYFGAEEVARDVPNIQAWVEGNILVVGDAKFAVTVNPPTIVSLKVPDCAMSGYVIVPQVQLEFADLYFCTWIWRQTNPVGKAAAHCVDTGTSHPNPAVAIQQEHDNPAPTPLSEKEMEELQVVSSSFTYWPLEEDCGKQLLLECTPASSNGRVGQPVLVSTKTVVPGPRNSSPITKRHLLTPAHLSEPDQFRVVSYNILADPYASTTFAREVLYPYCNPEALNVDYRQCLVVSELLGYHADVMCLQEVGTKVFKQFLLPALQEKGYGGCFQPKSGQIPEGEAVIFNANKLALISTECSSLSEFLQTHPSCSSLYKGLKAAPTVLQELTAKHTIVQLVFLKCLQKPDHFLCVANTHLYFHPMGDHIRLIQVEISLKFLKTALDAFMQTVGSQSTTAVLFCGDFNSCPCIAAYQYMLTGSVSKQHSDWLIYKLTEIPKCACNPRPPIFEQEEELEAEKKTVEGSVWPVCSQAPSNDDFEGLDLYHGFHFENATGTTGYTNYTSGYRGVLDYIFVDSEHLSVERIVPLPSLEEITEFVALPSLYFPSDHLALVADLKWKNK